MQSVVAPGKILFVDEVLTQGVTLRGSAVRVLGQCVPEAHQRRNSRVLLTDSTDSTASCER